MRELRAEREQTIDRRWECTEVARASRPARCGSWGRRAATCFAADDNPTGFWEDADVNKLNDDILALVDGRWYDVSALDDAQASRLREEGFEARATALLQGKMRAHDVFVIKDPRLTKLLASLAAGVRASGRIA